MNALFKRHSNAYEQFSSDDNPNCKSKLDLVRLSAVVCGIEFCYAAETAFVSPILLQLGLPVMFMTWIWCLPPLFGFFLVPALGSLSDHYQTRFGRRRPFILLYSIGILIGLLLVSNGHPLGRWFGDSTVSDSAGIAPTNQTSMPVLPTPGSFASRRWGIILTVFGVFLLDLDCDACQSPSRAYLLDVTHPSQHSQGLATFTSMAGLGGCLGYLLGGIPWEKTVLANILGDHTRIVFTLVWIIFIVCLTLTLTAAKEPTEIAIRAPSLSRSTSRQYLMLPHSMTDSQEDLASPEKSSMHEEGRQRSSSATIVSHVSYLQSILQMPSSLRWLCLTNFFCWMALVSYSLFFTDFVGQAVFGGNPQLEHPHPSRILYNDGVRYGSWAMAIYSLSCSIYSHNIQSLYHYFGIKRVYIASQLIYAVGMLFMGYLRHRVAVLVLSAVAGILYSTLFTIPYLLISRYYASNVFGQPNQYGDVRGIGTDIAIVGSMVFLAQLCLSLTMGTLIHLAGSTAIITVVASGLSICGAISATRVLYVD